MMGKLRQHAVFGASCYWGSEATFRAIIGIEDTAVGFMADSLCETQIPSSDDDAKAMCQVEVVQVVFDVHIVSYAQLLDSFWDCHDVTRNTHRPEDGRPSLERSVIFAANDEQRDMAKHARTRVIESMRFSNPVTTSIEPITHFHRAGESEQRYFERNEGVVCSAKLFIADANAAE